MQRNGLYGDGVMAGEGDTRRCRQCLLREMTNENDYYESVKRYRATLPPKKRTPDEIYEARLARCKSCSALENGTCRECGCYVEMRAARQDIHCPVERW
ncbi:MAG: DUF6171 family protein [Gemmiger sp.]|nr:DUF6171 family protein [Gemmiger sp.]